MPDSGPWFLSTIAVRTAIVLVALAVGVRIFGKRAVGGMNVYDLVLVLAIANAVQNAMTKGSGLLGVGIVSAGTLLVIDRLLGIVFTRRPLIEHRIIGGPTIIVRDGHLVPSNMRREGVTEAEVLAAVREYGLPGLDTVRLAVLEGDGTLSVVPATASHAERKRSDGDHPAPDPHPPI